VSCHRVDSEVLYSISKGKVQKGYHCAWQIHYHIVFPVKYRKALLDKMVIKIIEETVVRIFKNITAREIFRRHPEIKKDLWGGEFWSYGYYVATLVREKTGQKWKNIYKRR